MKSPVFVFIILFSLSGFQLFGQAWTIRGIVKAEEDGRPLKDVHVQLRESGAICLTDAHGSFQLEAEIRGSVRLVFDKPGFVVTERIVKPGTKKLDLQLVAKRTSAATHRWNKYIESEKTYLDLRFQEDDAWKCSFKLTKLKGDFAEDTMMVRRDPSALIRVDGLYFMYYTRGNRFSTGPIQKMFPWDQCDVWYATSKDGMDWEEEGPAVERGPEGSYDDASVFTPEVYTYKGKYYLVYQCVKAPYVDRVRNTIGMSVADSPRGPWRKLPEPILRTTPNGIWLGDDDSRNPLIKGDFDSHKVHDPCLLFYKGKFWLYYKGQYVGEDRYYGQRDIKWGVAIADHPEGPYVKSEYNPITNSGHEVCVWHYKGGIALMNTADGPEAYTLQWSPDGINFELMSQVEDPPEAPGMFRISNPGNDPLDGIRWGLSHTNGKGPWKKTWNYILRFDTSNSNTGNK